MWAWEERDAREGGRKRRQKEIEDMGKKEKWEEQTSREMWEFRRGGVKSWNKSLGSGTSGADVWGDVDLQSCGRR